jgi:hypothetical protein
VLSLTRSDSSLATPSDTPTATTTATATESVVVSPAPVTFTSQARIESLPALDRSDPLTVAAAYAVDRLYLADAMLSLRFASTTLGEYSGLYHASVAAETATTTYRLELIAREVSASSESKIWEVNRVIDETLEARLSVRLITTELSGVSVDVLQDHFNDASESRFLSIDDPVVTFNLSGPVLASSVTTDVVEVSVNGRRLSGYEVEYFKKDGVFNEQIFPLYYLAVDLSGVADISLYVGQEVELTLSDSLLGEDGKPLLNCSQCEEAAVGGEFVVRTRLFEPADFVELPVDVDAASSTAATMGTLRGEVVPYEEDCVSPRDSMSCASDGIVSTIYITDPAETYDVASVVREVVTDELGRFTAVLPVGQYSVFVYDSLPDGENECSEQTTCSVSEAYVCGYQRCEDGVCICAPVTIVSGKVTEVSLEVNHAVR